MCVGAVCIMIYEHRKRDRELPLDWRIKMRYTYMAVTYAIKLLFIIDILIHKFGIYCLFMYFWIRDWIIDPFTDLLMREWTISPCWPTNVHMSRYPHMHTKSRPDLTAMGWLKFWRGWGRECRLCGCGRSWYLHSRAFTIIFADYFYFHFLHRGRTNRTMTFVLHSIYKADSMFLG